MESVVSVDIGIMGGLALEEDAIPMPIVAIETKAAIMVLDLKNGKKQYYKSGLLKGEARHKIKVPAKYEKRLDLQSIYKYFNQVDVIVLESPGISKGNAANATATTNRNFGKLLACAELASCKIVTVSPNKWKKDLGLSKDKLESVELAEKLSGMSFRTIRGALMDGPAEAWLIGH